MDVSTEAGRARMFNIVKHRDFMLGQDIRTARRCG